MLLYLLKSQRIPLQRRHRLQVLTGSINRSSASLRLFELSDLSRGFRRLQLRCREPRSKCLVKERLR